MLVSRRRLRSGASTSHPRVVKHSQILSLAPPRRSRVRTLPQELIDRIIDSFKGQRETLITCTYVSHAFVRRAQQHLFEKFILYPWHEQKLKVLFEKSSHLAEYIKELLIATRSASQIGGPGNLRDILPKFTQLKCLSIKVYGYGYLDWQCDVSEDLRAGVAEMIVGNRIQEFVLQDIQNFDTLLLANCPSLRMIILGGDGSLAPIVARPHCPPTPPSLSAVMVGAGEECFQSLMNCCTINPPVFALDKLQWLGLRELPGESWMDSFQKLSEMSLPMLKHLVIELEIKSAGKISPATVLEPVDLSGFEHLSSIEFRNNSYNHDQTLFAQRSARILRSLSKPSQLDHIAFYCPGQLFATHHTPSRQSHWEDVDLALADGYPLLAQVHFKFGVNVFPLVPNILPMVTFRKIVTRLSRVLRPV
ncbi:hypothetical protein BJ912DRAFT_903269 [Pholiota molesta]|nr:hypothetical protein BJ912DRAFT_903269 [Pholiota molesta]